MSSSLDKLKALTSRLEDKLEQKEKVKPLVSSANEIIKSVEKVSLNKPAAKAVQTVVNQVERSNDIVREKNIIRVKELYENLKIFEKSADFNNIFIYKAMNLSGIGLKEEDFGEVREGKYIQIIAITYEPDKNGKKKAKNISLGYFGKAEILDNNLKNEIIEFVLRWRYEKAFQNVKHYKELIAKIEVS